MWWRQWSRYQTILLERRGRRRRKRGNERRKQNLERRYNVEIKNNPQKD